MHSLFLMKLRTQQLASLNVPYQDGVSSKFIMTGDTTQIDLPRKNDSGLLMAMRILAGIEGISIINLMSVTLYGINC